MSTVSEITISVSTYPLHEDLVEITMPRRDATPSRLRTILRDDHGFIIKRMFVQPPQPFPCAEILHADPYVQDSPLHTVGIIAGEMSECGHVLVELCDSPDEAVIAIDAKHDRRHTRLLELIADQNARLKALGECFSAANSGFIDAFSKHMAAMEAIMSSQHATQASIVAMLSTHREAADSMQKVQSDQCKLMSQIGDSLTSRGGGGGGGNASSYTDDDYDDVSRVGGSTESSPLNRENSPLNTQQKGADTNERRSSSAAKQRSSGGGGRGIATPMNNNNIHGSPRIVFEGQQMSVSDDLRKLITPNNPPKCPEGHSLSVTNTEDAIAEKLRCLAPFANHLPTIQSVTCNVCKQIFPISRQHIVACCRICDYDLCGDCYQRKGERNANNDNDKTPQNSKTNNGNQQKAPPLNNSAPPQQERLPRTRIIPPSPNVSQWRCDRGHPLSIRVLENKNSLFDAACDGCGLKTNITLRCDECDYDKCHQCVGYEAEMRCPQQHCLRTEGRASPLGSSRKCDECLGQIPPLHPLTRCSRCNYDLCAMCVIRKGMQMPRLCTRNENRCEQQ